VAGTMKSSAGSITWLAKFAHVMLAIGANTSCDASSTMRA
jgi:hypothetical protein